MGIKRLFRLYLFKKKWRKQNKHNFTSAGNVFNKSDVKVGNYSYGILTVLDDNYTSKIRIGSFCSLATDVLFVLGDEHPLNLISTYPFKVKFNDVEKESLSKGDIIIGDDVWVGARATILSGVKIGQGAVVGAGALVTKDVPPYAIVGGVPAKVIKYRFDEETIDKLLQIDFSKLTEKQVKENLEKLYNPVDKNSDLSFLK